MEFGAVNQRNISSGLAPRIDKKFSAVAQRIKSITDFKKELPTLEYIASKYPKSWILISAIYEEYGDYEGVKYSLREFLKTSKNNTEKAKYWLKLAEICRFTKDLEGESHAISEMVIIPGIPFEMISDCANRINSIFYNNPELRQAEYKKVLLQKIIDIMIQRIDEANATDYSRLAWILLNNNESERAKEFVEKGLEIDNFNTHCIRLYHKINSR